MPRKKLPAPGYRYHISVLLLAEGIGPVVSRRADETAKNSTEPGQQYRNQPKIEPKEEATGTV